MLAHERSSERAMVHDLLLLATSPAVSANREWQLANRYVKVRITEKPREQELDGVRLDRMERGSVREVSPSIGSWLITQGYADPEMRQESREENQDLAGIRLPRDMAHDRSVVAVRPTRPVHSLSHPRD